MSRRKAKKIQIGDKSLTYGTHVTDMMDSNDMFNKKDFVGLRRKLAEDGYLFVRGVVPSEIIAKARHAMLKQADAEKSIVINEKSSLNDAIIFRKGSKWSEGYCVDAVTGSETNGRENINIKVWQEIGPSQTFEDVYNGIEMQSFWKSLFGENATVPLVKQTFLRLMGNSGTVQHADYYYFKRDTHIFSGLDGLNAQKSAKQYLTSQQMWKSEIYEVKETVENENKKKEDIEEKYGDSLKCNICEMIYLKSDLDEKRRNRIIESENNKKGDFGMEGSWHCPKCAKAPLAIYTTWISGSQLNAPKDSILSVVPKSHLLTQWDLPQKNSQLPGDFNWKLKWVIPKSVDYGDIIIFNIKTVHASSLNASSPRAFRCSFDTRLQLLPIQPSMKKTMMINKNDNKKGILSPQPAKEMKMKTIMNDKQNIEQNTYE